MDVNGTKFHLLLGLSDWSSCTDTHGVKLGLAGDLASPPGQPGSPPVEPGSPPFAGDLAWDGRRHELTLVPIPYDPPSDTRAAPLQPSDRRGAASDSFGNWYWIGPDGRSILVRSSGSGTASTFWPAGQDCGAGDSRLGEFADLEPASPPPPPPLAGVAVTEDHFLVVGRIEPAGLLVFDLTSGGPPDGLPWPTDVPFSPFDMAPRRGGGVFILDRANAANGMEAYASVWELDRRFHVISSSAPSPPPDAGGGFGPLAGPRSGAGQPRPGLRREDATAVGNDTISVETGPGGESPPGADPVPQSFLTLAQGDAGGSLISLYSGGSALGAAVRISGVSGHDLALAGATLFVADTAGDRSYAFSVAVDGGQLALRRLAGFYPMRGFEGKALVSAAGKPYYDFGEGWIPLVDQPRPQYAESATLFTPVFDGAEPGCVWHRLMLDAMLPHDTRLAVSSKAADELDALDSVDWMPEPAPLPRASGPEVPFVDPGLYDTYELLFQRAQGRYLKILLELSGNGRATPRVRALRAWYPRFSYLERYLPRAYRQDPDSAAFLDRYLANLEGFYTAIEDRIAAAQVLMRADTAPAADLDWLASWFDLALDPMWDESRRRLLLANASAFFQARGTIRGVSLALRFVLERCIGASAFAIPQPPALSAPRIVEAYRTRSTPGVVFGDPTDQAAPRTVVPTPRWTPDQGRDVLTAGWLAFLTQQGLTGIWQALLAGQGQTGQGTYPIADPGGALSAPWSSFSSAALGFVPAAPDPSLWRAFLSRRYPGVAALAAAYGLSGAATPATFDDVLAPVTLPADGPALRDWFQIESVVIPMGAKASRFTVLLPWPMTVTDSQGVTLDQTQLRDLASRVVELQKPAHTVFAIKFFWAAFRIGDARIGDDTLLASGSRVPELVSEAVLGRNYIGETWLAGAAASDTIDRTASLEALRDTGEESQ
jgi:phage tail-like protein